MPLIEGVGDVLQEYKIQDDMFVLCGVYVVAELIGGCPEVDLNPKVSRCSLCYCCVSLSPCPYTSN
jgi:hypothetical protein